MGDRPIGDLNPLVELLRSLDAGTLEAWALGLTALAAAQADEPGRRDVAGIAEAAAEAERAAKAFRAPPAELCAQIALVVATSPESRADAANHLAVAEATAREMGLLAPPLTGLLGWREINSAASDPPASPAAWNGVEDRLPPGARSHGRTVSAPPLAIRLLGGFELEIDGRPVDVSAIRPRARALLRLLCLHAGAPVHHETIEAAMWPEAERDASARNLHVAIASLRRVVEPGASRGSFQLVRREDDAYRFALPDGAIVDLLRFEAALVAGRRASERGDEAGARQAYEAAHEAYTGELLPQDGPADWVADRREQARLGAVEAAQRLAEIYLTIGDSDGAARVANAGLRIERYHDPLWRLLIRSRDQAGDQGAATRARSGYGAMLAELDLPTGSTNGAGEHMTHAPDPSSAGAMLSGAP